jgi:hypothetical protein
MQTGLWKHLTDHNILSKEQYGFRTKLKTDNATYQLTNARYLGWLQAQVSRSCSVTVNLMVKFAEILQVSTEM